MKKILNSYKIKTMLILLVVVFGFCTFGCSDKDYVTDSTGYFKLDENDKTKIIGVTEKGLKKEQLEVPENITCIEAYAFKDCINLKTIDLKNVLYMKYCIFQGCAQLTSIVIPESVIEIDKFLFEGCTNLSSIIVNEDNKVYDSRNNCNAIIETHTNKLIAGCKNTIIPNDIERIESWAFGYCEGISSITIPNSVKSIGENAFIFCKDLTSIEIQDGVENIEPYAFSNCSNLNLVEFPNSIKQIDAKAFENTAWLSNRQKEHPLVIVNDLLVDGTTCKGDVKVPDGIQTICSFAFNNCKLSSIEIPNTVTYIGESAFIWCEELSTIKFSDNVEFIGSGAFAFCKNLESVNIPQKIKSIENGLFRECESLRSITIHSNITNIGEMAFYGCDNLESVYFEHETAPTFNKDCFTWWFNNSCIFYFKNIDVSNALKDDLHYKSGYINKSDCYDW